MEIGTANQSALFQNCIATILEIFYDISSSFGNFFAIGQIVIVTNGPILNKWSSHWSWPIDRYFRFRKALQFLRGEDFDIKEELNEMIKLKESNEASMASSSNTWTWTFKRLASRAYLKPFFCIGFIKIFMTWGGMNILMMYMVNVFRGSTSSIDPELAPVFVGIVRVFSSVCSSYLMRTASRKILFIVCMSIIAFGNLIIAT